MTVIEKNGSDFATSEPCDYIFSLGVIHHIKNPTDTLKNIKRDNIKMDFFKSLQQKYVKADLVTYTELILPLPGETYESFKEGINNLLDS